MEHPFESLQFTEYPESEMLRRSGEFHEDMSRRRSVRHFSDRTYDPRIAEQAILTANTAPSGAHKQPWSFVLVGDPRVKQQIREAAEKEERESYEHRMPPAWIESLEPLGTDWHKPFLTTCPWLIVVFAQLFGRDPEGDKVKHYYVQESVGIAVGMLLAALHHAGLATLTHTPSPMAFLKNVLARPDNERAYMLIATGFPEPGCKVPALQRKPPRAILTRV